MTMNLQQLNPPHPARRWDPFREMEEMQERLTRMFDLAPLRSDTQRELMSACEWAPLVDISEDDHEYLVKAELPEVKNEDVKVSGEFKDGLLKVHVPKDENAKAKVIQVKLG